MLKFFPRNCIVYTWSGIHLSNFLFFPHLWYQVFTGSDFEEEACTCNTVLPLLTPHYLVQLVQVSEGDGLIGTCEGDGLIHCFIPPLFVCLVNILFKIMLPMFDTVITTNKIHGSYILKLLSLVLSCCRFSLVMSHAIISKVTRYKGGHICMVAIKTVL